MCSGKCHDSVGKNELVFQANLSNKKQQQPTIDNRQTIIYKQ